MFSTICGTVVKKKIISRGARFQGFWDFSGHFEVEGARNFWCRECVTDRTAGFHHVLSVSVVPSVSVESAVECQMRCPMTCFCTVSLSGTMRSLNITVLCYSKEKPPFAATQALSLRTQALPIFSNSLTAACPRSVSSSSSASIFGVLRDSQILGSDRLKKSAQKKMRQNRTRRSTEGLNWICGNATHAPKMARKTCAKTIARHG